MHETKLRFLFIVPIQYCVGPFHPLRYLSVDNSTLLVVIREKKIIPRPHTIGIFSVNDVRSFCFLVLES